ncbi:unnamed protein product [Notodromas monacha]|uniref:S-adenosylmethionine decarboxylase proenzyme n=1 Tax=Notodromas monacha TaxID=399045 RepID=A0A7R9GBR6_9CRUS|nr:unnamed protein product [Notodromas monacha]CAG0915338.1 unnamed protein product [Notodromas monacha]
MESSLDPDSGLRLPPREKMSELSPHFFEGTEKLLEVWFSRRDEKLDDADLRKIPRHELEVLMNLVKCEIISFTQNDSLDSYVLSESSMFISKRRFILKTCGTTVLLGCLKKLTQYAFNYGGFDEVEDIFYSRKNFMRPELQPDPHSNFSSEVQKLDEVFEDGAAYCLGQMNGDCWYLYTLNRPGNMADSDDDGYVSAGDSPWMLKQLPSPCTEIQRVNQADQTLEKSGISTLIPDVQIDDFLFDPCGYSMNGIMKKKSGISTLIPDVQIDDFLFDPCGYSMNGIMKKGSYMTIHVTPEPDFSYVSFESNIPMASYKEVLGKILDIFKPGKFIMTVFANQGSVAMSSQIKKLNSRGSVAMSSHKELDGAVRIGKFMRKDLQSCQFRKYHLTYAHYVKFPS